MKLTIQDLKYPQVDAAFRYIYDNYNQWPELYNGTLRDVVEFGVYKCGSLRKICSYLRDNWSYSYVYGIDAWEGLPSENEDVEVFEKFTPGSYKAEQPDLGELRVKFDYTYLYLINKWFSDLTKEDATTINKCMLIHVDCDLASSTEQALSWCFDNKLIGKHTLVAFDEFETTDALGGEQLAWYNISNAYDFTSEEIWFNTYYDKGNGQKIRQSIWEITSIEE